MTELVQGNIDNAVNKIRQKVTFFRKWKEFRDINRVERDLKKIGYEHNKILKIEQSGKIGATEKEILKDIALCYDAADSFLNLERNIIYLAKEIEDKEKDILNLIEKIEKHGFPKEDGQKIHQEAARALLVLKHTLRKTSDMLGAIEKSN